MANQDWKIIYTKTDEAPALATYSFLPIVQTFAKSAGVELETKDISLAARIIAKFPDFLNENQRVPDALTELGELAKKPQANIIKLPNISASIPQLTACIKELKDEGYALPDYPEEPENDQERDVKARYDKIKGSAVNPVLREGNSDRRAPGPVKQYAKNNPHSMGAWSSASKSHVSTMSAGDFKNNEKSLTLPAATSVDIVLETANGSTTLKSEIALQKDEVIDGTFLSKKALIAFLNEQIEDAKSKDILFSLHMKATMMKVSDPIIFGHAITTFFSEVFDKYEAELEEANADPNNGLGDVLAKVEDLPADKAAEIKAAFAHAIEHGPDIAMVDSDRGITNLHVPSDVIIDASMPAMIRTSGKMWNKDGNQQDAKAVIPDSSYAGIYQSTIDFCKKNGAFDPSTMGTIPNVGLMAQKAEEYGSHDKTFEIQEAGTVKVVDASGSTLMEHNVEQGDIWRMCQVKDAPVQDWVKLAVTRARATGWPAIFWLDNDRAHDAELIKKVNAYLPNHDTSGLEILIKSPVEATDYSLARMAKGENTISVTGNVLRDYNTDLFPILELGTSAKMLSIVPLMNGGGLFETGAGGSAPKLVQQLVEENHLRWDSLGEFLALAASLDHFGEKTDNRKAQVLGDALEKATEKYLLNRKSPSRKVMELDNRGSHFYLSMYWAQELAAQSIEPELATVFTTVAEKMKSSESTIIDELNNVQGVAVNLEGYYYPHDHLASAAMRPSATFNAILESV